MKRILPVIVLAQFFCTSLWFAGNAIMPDLMVHFTIDTGFLAHLTSAVQLGFITGTLVFAIFTVSDRFSPVRVFFVASLAASLCNLGVSLDGIDVNMLLVFRFLTGFFLAGIYPVGMKIASDHFQQGLGRSLGFLVGALVLGTALPHLLKSFSFHLPWKAVVYDTSALSVIGGICMLVFVPDGPHRKSGQKIRPGVFFAGFKNRSFRAAAFGYFGHMWELYAFWAFLPVMLTVYQKNHPATSLNISLLSFLIIGSGSIACMVSGSLSKFIAPKKIARTALLLSCNCCILSPVLFSAGIDWLLIGFLFFWGWVVVADSPLFSTMVAHNAPADTRGTSLTFVNCIGFAITIISIQLIRACMTDENASYIFLLLAVGPLLGLWVLFRNNTQTEIPA